MDAGKDDLPQEKRQTCPEKILATTMELLGRLYKVRGVIFALGIAIFCTALNILSYIAGETMHPTTVTFWTSITMTSLSVVALILARPSFQQSVKTVIYLICCSFLTGGGSISLLLGIMISEPTDAVSLFFTMPFILIILEAIIKKQKTKLSHILLTFCSMVGVILVARPSFLFKPSSTNHTWGILFGLLSAFLHSGTFMVFRELAENDIHPLILSIFTSIGLLSISTILCVCFKAVAFPPNVKVLASTLSAGVSHFCAYNCVSLAVATERPFIVSIIS